MTTKRRKRPCSDVVIDWRKRSPDHVEWTRQRIDAAKRGEVETNRHLGYADNYGIGSHSVSMRWDCAEALVGEILELREKVAGLEAALGDIYSTKSGELDRCWNIASLALGRPPVVPYTMQDREATPGDHEEVYQPGERCENCNRITGLSIGRWTADDVWLCWKCYEDLAKYEKTTEKE